MSVLGRPCSTCNSPNIREIHARVLRGDSIPLIAVENRLSASSIYRHLRSHVGDEFRSGLSPAQQIEVSDLATRVLDIADDLRLARERTQRNGSATATVRAASAELRVLESLIDRLGVDSRETSELLSNGEALARAVGTAVRLHPEVAPLIAGPLRERGHPELAQALEGAAQPTELENRS